MRKRKLAEAVAANEKLERKVKKLKQTVATHAEWAKDAVSKNEYLHAERARLTVALAQAEAEPATH